MSKISKAGVVLASAVGVAFALTGCASQQSGAATPQNLPNNCASYAQPAQVCKGYSKCKTVRHKHKVVTTTTTTSSVQGSEQQQ
ncbi:MAG TPA: hypothetical protein VHE99_01255 [Gammaproteobacteria bacterium]|nr:hypothetical protein [Gammaproteobacteria bacterium]